MTLLDEAALRELLREACAKVGSQQAWAKRHDLSGSYVTDVLRGRRGPGQGLLDAMGYERIVGYRKKADARTTVAVQ